MKKISTNGTNNILLKYILRVVILTIISILVLSYIFSKIMYHLDLDMKYESLFSIFICAICALITGSLSVWGIKNNGLVLGMLAQIPLLFYSILNVIFNESSFVFFLIKAVIVLSVGMLTGYVSSKKSSRLRI